MRRAEYGLMMDYEYCTGCQACIHACALSHGFSVEETGIKITQIGPVQISGDRWELDFIPVPTDKCDLCVSRLQKQQKPACVKHCQATVIVFDRIDRLAAMVTSKPKQAIYVPNESARVELPNSTRTPSIPML